jgi:hypothetical protein
MEFDKRNNTLISYPSALNTGGKNLLSIISNVPSKL